VAYVVEQEFAGLDIFVDSDARFDSDVAGRQWSAHVAEWLKSTGRARANLVRCELKLPEADVLAADPKVALVAPH